MEELREEEEEEGDSFTVQVLSFRSGSVRQNAVCVVRTNCFVIVFVFLQDGDKLQRRSRRKKDRS